MSMENPTPGNAKETAPSLAGLRMEYRRQSLRRAEVATEPYSQFRQWFAEAQASGIIEPNAMTLSTVDAATGQPSSRVVLLKGLDDAGFTFFSNYASRKGKELAAQPRAALGFFWHELERQVNVRGVVERLSREESLAYFQSRPRASQLGAHASAQSNVIPSRRWLEQQFVTLEQQYPIGTSIPLPSSWGGYRLVPEVVEFWQGRPSRLHDRICYARTEAGAWRIDRLSP